METKIVSIVFVIYFVAAVQAMTCPCSADMDDIGCTKKRDFISLRLVNESLVDSVPSQFATVGDNVYSIMQQTYSSGLDYLKLSLAPNGNPTVAANGKDDFSASDSLRCHYSYMKKLSITVPGGSTHEVNLEMRNRALEGGLSVEVLWTVYWKRCPICSCKDLNNPITKNDKTKPGPCSDDLINYLRVNAEYRLNIVVSILQS